MRKQILETPKVIINPYRYDTSFNFETGVTSANLLHWLEAGDDLENSSGTPATEGQTCEYWRDKSTNGNDWSQATSGERPIFDADAGSKFNNGPAAFFDTGVGALSFDGPNYSGESALDCFILLYRESDTPASGDTGLQNFGTGTQGHHPWTDGKTYSNFATSSRKTATVDSVDWTTPVIYNELSEASNFRIWINESDYASPFYSTATNTVGIRTAPMIGISSATYKFDGRIALHLLYDGKVSDADRVAIWDAIDEMRTV